MMTQAIQLRPFQHEELPLVESWFLDAETQRWLGVAQRSKVPQSI